MTSPLPAAFDNRVSRDLGVDIPIVQAPMGWIARSQLASAVSQAGACGIIETSSGELDAVKDEIRKMRDLTDRPFGVNIAQAFVRDPAIAEFVIDQGVKFVTTSAGSPTKYTGVLKEAGLTVYHVVPTLAAALKAVDAGVDGLVVEGGEGGGFKSPTPVSTMVLLPLVRSKVDVPIIAAGGITDGATMAAAFALGAEGVQMGTRMVSAAESPVHDNWKQAIVDAAETDTLFLNQRHSPALRALRTERTEALVERRAQRVRRLRQRARPLLRRRHERRDRAVGPGRRADRVDRARGDDHRRHRRASSPRPSPASPAERDAAIAPAHASSRRRGPAAALVPRADTATRRSYPGHMALDDELINRITWKIPNALALVGSAHDGERNAMTTSWITHSSMEPRPDRHRGRQLGGHPSG